MRWKCDNFNCANFIVNCDCSRVIIHDLKSSYRCPCGFEYIHCITGHAFLLFLDIVSGRSFKCIESISGYRELIKFGEAIRNDRQNKA